MAKKVIKGRGVFAREVTAIGGAVSDPKAMAELAAFLKRFKRFDEAVLHRMGLLRSVARAILAKEGFAPIGGDCPNEENGKAFAAWHVVFLLDRAQEHMEAGRIPDLARDAFDAGMYSAMLGIKFTDLEELADIGRKVSAAGGSKPKGDKAEVRRLWGQYRAAHPNLSEDQCDRAIGAEEGLSASTIRRYRLAK